MLLEFGITLLGAVACAIGMANTIASASLLTTTTTTTTFRAVGARFADTSSTASWYFQNVERLPKCDRI